MSFELALERIQAVCFTNCCRGKLFHIILHWSRYFSVAKHLAVLAPKSVSGITDERPREKGHLTKSFNNV